MIYVMESTLAAGSSPVAIVASIERLGGRGPLPVGIFLLDRVRDELHLRFREDWSMVADAEAVEIMEGLAELFIQRAREEGPTNLLHELLHQSSNYVRLGEPLTLPEPVDYKDELDRLYAENVGTS